MRILTDTAHTGRTSTIARYPGPAHAVIAPEPFSATDRWRRQQKKRRENYLSTLNCLLAQDHHAPAAGYALIDDGERCIYEIDIAEHKPRMPKRFRLGNSRFF